MEYKNITFNADKVKLYKAVREALAHIKIFYEEELAFFEPPVIIPMPAPVCTRSVKGRFVYRCSRCHFDSPS